MVLEVWTYWLGRRTRVGGCLPNIWGKALLEDKKIPQKNFFLPHKLFFCLPNSKSVPTPLYMNWQLLHSLFRYSNESKVDAKSRHVHLDWVRFRCQSSTWLGFQCWRSSSFRLFGATCHQRRRNITCLPIKARKRLGFHLENLLNVFFVQLLLWKDNVQNKIKMTKNYFNSF